MALFGRDRTLITDKFGTTLSFDAVVKEDTELAVTVTDHPIEDGANVVDHIRDEPDRLTIDVVQSRTPIELTPLLLTESSSRHNDAWNQFYEWLKGHALLKVRTSVRTYQDMALESVSRTRSATVGESFEGSLKLKQIVKVKSSTAAAPTRPATVQKPQIAGGVATPATVENQTIVSKLPELLNEVKASLGLGGAAPVAH